MNISDASINLSSVRPPVEGTPAVSEAAKVPGSAQQSANADILLVREGQVFDGKITDVSGSDVSILLDNNKTLSARMADAMNFNIGDSLSFMVKENDGVSVMIRPFGDVAGQMKDQAIFSILEKNGISPSDKNFQIVDSLMKQQLPLDKGTMQKMMQQSLRFPDTKMDTLAALNKLNLPVTAENIGQYESYLSNSHQLTSDVAGLANRLGDIFSTDITTLGSADAMLGKSEQLLSILAGEGDGVSIEDAIDDLIDRQATGAGATVEGERLPTVLSDTSMRLSLPEEQLRGIAEALNKMGVSDETVAVTMKSSDSATQLLQNLNELLQNGGTLVPEKNTEMIKSLLSSGDFKALIEYAVREKMTLDGSKMESPDEVNDLYKSIYEKAGKLAEAFADSGSSAGKDMYESAKGMQQRIDFMQNLNEMFGYAQLPVRMENREMNSDLFVYMNKKSIREKKEDVSALLHLDMDHLGPTDCHVSLRGTMVHTKFYVEDELSAKIIDEHLSMLEKAVAEVGFTLQNETHLREPSVSGSGNMVVDEMLGTDLEQSVKRYSFDVRT